jgi:Cysteine dioxygenase type I
MYFSAERYTRNLIQATSLYELIALCWEVGQRSTIHNHRDQRCCELLPSESPSASLGPARHPTANNSKNRKTRIRRPV